jgi:4-diphosphocytidyl-2-C-methyl-D-erythritol kinase
MDESNKISSKVVVYPNAKINIGLSIKEKRADGYHNLQSIFYPIPLTDILEIIPADEYLFSSSGISVEHEGNLVEKAYKLIDNEYKIGAVHIHLHKMIPLGAGLGGGSADASFTLRALNKLFKLELTDEKLHKLALEIGSDCPFFIHNTPSFVEGRGEIIQSSNLSLNGYYIKILKPDIHISTADAFANLELSANKNPLSSATSTEYLLSNQEVVKNDFESSVFKMHSKLQEIKKSLINEGAVYSSLTGTGSAVYGIFKDKPKSSSTEKFEFISELK